MIHRMVGVMQMMMMMVMISRFRHRISAGSVTDSVFHKRVHVVQANWRRSDAEDDPRRIMSKKQDRTYREIIQNMT